MRDTIRFLKNGEVVELDSVGPTETLLDYLRLRRRETGTKEGCGEGDCGACTVALGRLVGGKMVYQPVNSCIQLLGMIDGAELVTVEDLASDQRLHPVQKAMVDLHGSQCGFCTPGFIMTLFTLYHAEEKQKSRKTVTEWLAGNLCRCTGYRPIVDAALEACFDAADDAFTWRANETRQKLQDLADSRDVYLGDSNGFFASPSTLDGLAALYAQHPDATIVAGATDVALWVTKNLAELPKIIWLGRIEELDRVEETGSGVLIGATATYAATEAAMTRIETSLGALWKRIGSKQVRASGTIGGNIANGSPIGDTPPALIALGATLELHSADGSRALPLEDFFLEYGKQDRRDGEFVTGLFVPGLSANQVFRCYKISKRFDQDISAVMAGFRFALSDGVITEARIAYGGMAGTPKRAATAEAALAGASLEDPATWGAAMQGLISDFTPMTDMRASSAYRMETARALLAKALMEISGTAPEDVNVLIKREVDHDRAA
ncbi:xanthine dehydrogenase small subunit [Roseibium denhamense]|uniref:Xanthine dehydrogenase small subunit n=1 Tax=Roseibium denhamense TaxID=76305 RepID=A0ABY1NPU5_9HYPH|nr:xanthine dehydrogenase small subunit [Roseibium denhamense]MTI07958.1 xanthine dehydrogenase small subunit [Roseibium denhamense]SMP15188.1 xanthine dehydrogenase small subunit [Roseibium denhamense]